jgi:hypothetical protein
MKRLILSALALALMCMGFHQIADRISPLKSSIIAGAKDGSSENGGRGGGCRSPLRQQELA